MNVTTLKINLGQLCGINDEAGETFDAQLAVYKQLAWHNMELRSVAGVALANLADIEINKLQDKLMQANIQVPVLASKIGDWSTTINTPLKDEITQLKRLLNLAKLFGSKFIRIMSYPNHHLSVKEWEHAVVKRIVTLAEIAAESQVKLLHENCHGFAATQPERALQLIAATKGHGFGLLFDIGNPLVGGYDGYAYLEKVISHVEHVHIKDVLLQPNAEPRFSFPGKGQVNIRKHIDLLLTRGYRGCFSIEPHIALIPHQHLSVDNETLQRSYYQYGVEFMQYLADYLREEALA